jgi:hypothetical protein
VLAEFHRDGFGQAAVVGEVVQGSPGITVS